MKCEWCGSEYPKGGQVLWEVRVFDTLHIICDDCRKHLKKVKE